MKVDLPGTWHDAPASTGASRATSDGKPAAFAQLLRVMEKDMWLGAKAGAMAQDRLPEQTRRTPEERFNRASAFNARADSHAMLGGKTRESDGPVLATSARVVASEALTLNAPLAYSLNAGPRESRTVPLPTTTPLAPASTRTEDSVSRDASVQRLNASRSAVPIWPAVTPANSALNAATTPYRLTVMNGEAGVSIALRINPANADESDRLGQRTLDELQRADTRVVRLVINGVEHIPTTSRGIAHGH